MRFFHDTIKKKILILIGHPDSDNTLSSQLALLYETAAKSAGHEVHTVHLAQMQFDPILHKGYKVIQELEPDLKHIEAELAWCDHFVVIYPTWWCSMPALLKGMFDRIWLPGFCFNYYKKGWRQHLHLWKRKMRKKTARVITLSGSAPLFIWLLFGGYTNEIARALLWFVGFKVRVTHLGPSEIAPEWKRNEWRRHIIRLGKMGE